MKRQTSIVFLTGIALAAAVLVFMAVIGTGGVQASSAPPTLTVGDITTNLPAVPLETSISASAYFTDPTGISTSYTAVLDWGDDTSSSCTYVPGVPGPDDVSSPNSNSEECTVDKTAVTPEYTEYLVTGSHVYTDPHFFPVVLTVTDSNGASDTSRFEYVVVYDPDNVAPTVGEIAITPMEPININDNEPIFFTAIYTDPSSIGVDTVVLYWGDESDIEVCTTSDDSDCQLEPYEDDPRVWYVNGSHAYTTDKGPGIYTIHLTVSGAVNGDAFDPVEVSSPPVVVYDPSGGFVTGGGWINSPENAYTLAPTLTGKATFGFVSKYKKGANAPTGNTQFQFKAGDLKFHSDSYDWLVIAGHKAMYKGTGTVNGAGNYGFLLSAIDADLTPSADVDRFRIKIWDKDDGDALIYDNQVACEDTGTGDAAEPCTDVGGGSIVIHKAKKK